MDFVLDAITEWLKELLVSGIIGNLSGMFDSVNEKVGGIAAQVGATDFAPEFDYFLQSIPLG